MNVDQLKVHWLGFKGDVKQLWDAFDLCQTEGSYEKITSMLQERYDGRRVSLIRERYSEKKKELISWTGQWLRKKSSLY